MATGKLSWGTYLMMALTAATLLGLVFLGVKLVSAVIQTSV